MLIWLGWTLTASEFEAVDHGMLTSSKPMSISYIFYLVGRSKMGLLDSRQHSIRLNFLVKHFRRVIKNSVVRPLLDTRDLIPVLIPFL